jgi:dethiobiotin synthetase
MAPRPTRLVAVLGTGTEVGKTWVSARLLQGLRSAGMTVAARKPAQSFDPSDDPAGLDAAVLGAASGEAPSTVCPESRWYEVAMAPPMAASVLGRPSFTVADLVTELGWTGRETVDTGVDVGLVETAGGVRSPIADDGDCLALCAALRPDRALLVADAGLGTINAVRLAAGALRDAGSGADIVVVLNRFDPQDDLHVRNRAWLAERDGLDIVALPGEEADLVARVLSTAT